MGTQSLPSGHFLGTLETKRNRHSVENDIQSALIKRINRLYTKRGCDRKVQVVNGKPTLINTTTGQARPTFFRDLSDLWIILNQAN
jgi:hypothetical protein